MDNLALYGYVILFAPIIAATLITCFTLKNKAVSAFLAVGAMAVALGANVLAALKVFDRDDLGDPWPPLGSDAVHDQVDGFGHQGVQRAHRELIAGLCQLADESKTSEGLAGRAGVDGGEAGHAGAERQQQGQCLAVANLADDRDVGCHAEEAGHQPSEINRITVDARRPRLHRRNVGDGDVGFEHLFGDHDPLRRVDLGGTAREHRGLARAGCAREHHAEARPHGRRQERRHGVADHRAVDELVELGEGHAGELADVDHQVGAAGHVLMHDVQPRPVVELRVLEPLGRVELAV